MKALLLTLLLAGGVCFAGAAQHKDRHLELPGTVGPTPARVHALTRQMCDRLHLNEGQYVRLLEINRIKLTRLDELAWQYGEDAPALHARVGELEAQYEAECGRILTSTQLSLLRGEQHDTVPAEVSPTEGGLG